MTAMFMLQALETALYVTERGLTVMTVAGTTVLAGGAVG
jgi:hypothetical protein